jgi:secreted Zn-dependent insulinase-like peptidase
MTVEDKGSGFKVICDDITKSEGDDRSYRGLVLQNDMKILIVSDSNTEKAAASMDVHIGNKGVWKYRQGRASRDVKTTGGLPPNRGLLV